MVYEDREDEFIDIDEQQMYEDTFREQIPADETEGLEPDETIEADAPASTTEVKDGFGESINADTITDPDEQLEDEGLSEPTEEHPRAKD